MNLTPALNLVLIQTPMIVKGLDLDLYLGKKQDPKIKTNVRTKLKQTYDTIMNVKPF